MAVVSTLGLLTDKGSLKQLMEIEVLSAVTRKTVFWNLTLCELVVVYCRIGGR
jgi:hypothetical protein